MITKIKLSAICILILVLFGCGKKDATPDQNQKDGIKLTVYCDEAIFKLMTFPFQQIDSILVNDEVSLQKVTAFDAMAKFLAGDAEFIVLARDYSHREDSLMKIYKVNSHIKMPVAHDALVLYTQNGFPLDTISDVQIKAIFTQKGTSLQQYFPKLSSEPEFVINSNLSSELENLKTQICSNEPITKKLKVFGSSDSVIKYVTENKNTIGIGYLSQVINIQEVKPLNVGFDDSTGRHILTTVHQANIVQGYYPYKVTLYSYVIDDKTELPLMVQRFVAKHRISQSYFNDYGIVPAFAKIKLIEED